MVVYVVAYILVALGFMVYSRLRFGPWLGRDDFVFDVEISALWPLSFVAMWAIDRIRDWAYGGDKGGI